jgi:hypothetical protein
MAGFAEKRAALFRARPAAARASANRFDAAEPLMVLFAPDV